MPYINLTGLPTNPNTEDDNCCVFCSKPFKHYTKMRKVKGCDEVKLDLITSHTCCKRTYLKMEKIKNKIIKTKQMLHNLRTEQLNLEFEMFAKQQLKLDDDTDEIFVMMKEKGILN